ncbi:putative integral membrane protein [Theileria parva strain Muguga]|uniref:putative integral membrane protein n=1 Tax=Theileria parva strain Muguga TaxID=333668 RepID=UPI001C61B092|nr:putative integral membrane protein [Theileria parva strain Muguga]EAN31630.2 putative integral membrane protein [Theileria parva strain Muguga]
MNKDVNIFFSCNLKYILLILIFYFISFTEGFITTNRHGINVNHVFNPSSKCILSRKQNHQECFLFNNTDVSNNTGVTFGTECLNNLLNTTNTVPNIDCNVDDDIIHDMITPEQELTYPLISKSFQTFHGVYTNHCLYVDAIIRADEINIAETLRKQIKSMISYGINHIWKYNVLDANTKTLKQDDVYMIKRPGVAIAFNYKISKAMQKKLSEKNIKLIKGEKIDNILEMAWDELIRIAGQNRIVTIYGKAEVKEVAKDSEDKNAGRCVVTYGKINPFLNVRIIRGDRIFYYGKISTSTKGIQYPIEIYKGETCWITLEEFDDIKVGDVIEAYSD